VKKEDHVIDKEDENDNTVLIYLSHPCVTRMCNFNAICDPVS